MDIKLTFHRGGAELGGVAMELVVDDQRFLLDAGVGGQNGEGWTDGFGSLDGIWISHAHLDHCGALPDLMAGRPTLGGWCTAETRRLVEHTLGAVDGVDETTAEAMGAALSSVPTRHYTDIGDGIRIMPFPAGHVAGAAMVVVEIGEEPPTRILYTGDFCCHDQPVLPGAQLPVTDDFAIDTLIIEGMLATDREADELDPDKEWDRFVEYAGTEAPTLVAAAALGEAVEAAGSLAPTETEVVVDMTLKPVFEVYQRSPAIDRAPGDVTFAEGDGVTAAIDRGATAIAPGEQFGAGSATRKAVAGIVGRKDTRIALMNRVYGGSFAGELRDAEPGDPLEVYPDRAATVELAAEVEYFTLPNHAPRWQLVETVEAIDADRTVLVHGRESQLQTLRRAIGETSYDGEVVVPGNGDAIRLESR
ncbi:MAG: MBL fold metallo-hydrolase [Bradymonadaceae bacterium]